MFKKVIITLCIAVVAVSCSQNSKQKSGQVLEPTTTTAPADNQSAKDPHAGETGFTKPTNADILIDEIKNNYKGVKIFIDNKQMKGKGVEVDIPFKELTEVKTTKLSVVVESFFTNFTMDNTGAINKSLEESNPAAKVKIYKNNALIFDGWLFQNFPDIHQFDDAEYAIFLKKGNKK